MIVYGDLSGTKDGVNLNFIIPVTLVGSVLILFNTSPLYPVGATPTNTQCIISGTSVTLGLAPDANDNLMYYGDDAVNMHSGDLSGTKNGSNTSFTLPESLVSESILIILNTSILYHVANSPGVTQMILSGSNVTVGLAPDTTDNLWYYGEPA